MTSLSVIPITQFSTMTKMLSIFFRILLVTLLFRSGFGNLRINQGTPIDIMDAPYMARVRIKISATVGFACDGSILSDLYILTAGHCVTDESNIYVPNPPIRGPSNFSILIGTTDLDYPEKGDVYSVSKVFFREYSSKNDIAILRLTTRIKFDGITKMPVTLPSNAYYYPKNRTDAYVDGWGTNPESTYKLLRAEIYTISVRECNTGADVGRDRTYQICTLGNNGAGPCLGDSGGPMTRADDGVQIGIVSFVPYNCENPRGLVSTFTSVARNLPWIRRITSGDGENDQLNENSNMPTATTTTRRPVNLFGSPHEATFSYFNNKP